MTDAIQMLFKNFEILKERIMLGEVSGSTISDTLKGMSQRDYRTIEEVAIDGYVETFLGGAMRTVDTDLQTQTARNSAKTEQVKDLDYHIKRFMAEDFMKVQKPFWAAYKLKHNKTNLDQISTKQIYSAIQKQKELAKAGKI